VIDINGQPLMPTKRHGKVRRLLKTNKAKVVKRCPFTIQLLYESDNKIQPISLGVDAGSKYVGISATTETEELYAAEVELRNDIVSLLSTRRENRHARRNRKTRYRKPRFNNRIRSKHKGWLAPSVENKINTHIKAIEDICKILPISDITIEVAAFDTQKLKADLDGLKMPDGTDYQHGEQLGFWNVREYVLFRDNHTCQCCKGKSKDKVLNVHHIESRKTGGNAPNNLITLCETCHQAYHKGKIKLPDNIKRKAAFKDATFMGIMRWAVYNKLKDIYEPKDINIHMTYGYITKNTRIKNNIEKSHIADARCISGNPFAKPALEIFYQKKVRCHNRQIHKMSIGKGGYRKLNQAPKEMFGFKLFDKVLLDNKEGFVFGRRKSGSFDIRTLDSTKLSAGISYKKLTLLECRKTILTERRKALLPMAKARGFRA
jgi:hypothetical protein